MKRVFLLICLLAFAGTAFAGFSLGFKYTDFPVGIYATYDPVLEDMYMLRFGAMASPSIRVEALLGYSTYSFETDPDAIDYSGTMYVFGGGGYYVLEAPANTTFSIGAQFLYGKTTGEEDSVDEPETTTYSLSPLMRIDFAIPGAERLAFYTEYGIRYASVTTTVEDVAGDIDYKWTGWHTYSPRQILAGVYYVF